MKKYIGLIVALSLILIASIVMSETGKYLSIIIAVTVGIIVKGVTQIKLSYICNISSYHRTKSCIMIREIQLDIYRYLRCRFLDI